MSNPIKTCTSIDCPERKSICCGAESMVYTDEDGGLSEYVCSKCGDWFVGGDCTSEVEISTDDVMKRFEEYLKDITIIYKGEKLVMIKCLPRFIQSEIRKERERIKGKFEEILSKDIDWVLKGPIEKGIAKGICESIRVQFKDYLDSLK